MILPPKHRRDCETMKYLSGKPFTAGANSRAYVDRWEETFGRKDMSDPDPPALPDRLCAVMEDGSPCILHLNHMCQHYTSAEKAAYQAAVSRREDERLDFLVNCRLKSFGDPQPCDGDGEISSAKERSFPSDLDRRATMIELVRRLKYACLNRQILTLAEGEIVSLLLLLQDLKNMPGKPNPVFP